MKGKYITSNMMMAFTKKRKIVKNDIHAELRETIAERGKIMKQLEKYTQTASIVQMIITDTNAA